MQYMLLFYGDYEEMMSRPKEEAMQTHAAFTAYTEAMKQAGAYVGSAGLAPPPNATTVRAPAGKAQVLNGPFADTREQLAGYYLIDVPDLDAALSWAKRHPGSDRGAIEVRPLWG